MAPKASAKLWVTVSNCQSTEGLERMLDMPTECLRYALIPILLLGKRYCHCYIEITGKLPAVAPFITPQVADRNWELMS